MAVVSSSTSFPDLRAPPGYRIRRKPPPTIDISERYPTPDPLDPFAPLWVLRGRTGSSVGPSAYPYLHYAPYGTPSQDTLANSVYDLGHHPESRPQSPDAYMCTVRTTTVTTTTHAQVAVPRVLKKPTSLRSPSPSPPKTGHYRPYSQIGFNRTYNDVGATESRYGLPVVSRRDSYNASQTQLSKPKTSFLHPWPTASVTDVCSRRAAVPVDSSGTDTDSDAPPMKVGSGPLRRGASNNSTTTAANRLTKFLLPKKNGASTGVVTDTSTCHASAGQREDKRNRRHCVRKSTISAPIISSATWEAHDSDYGSVAIAIQARTGIAAMTPAEQPAHIRRPTSVIISSAGRGSAEKVYVRENLNETRPAPMSQPVGASIGASATVDPTTNDSTRKGNSCSRTRQDVGVAVTAEASLNGAKSYSTGGRNAGSVHDYQPVADDHSKQRKYSSDTDITAHYLRGWVPAQTVDAGVTPRYRDQHRDKTLPVEPLDSGAAIVQPPCRPPSRARTPVPPVQGAVAPSHTPPPAAAGAPIQGPPPPPKMFKRRISLVSFSSSSSPPSKSKPPAVTSVNGGSSAQASAHTQTLPTTHSISNTSIVNISISTPRPAPAPESLAHHTAGADAYIAPRPAPRPPGILRASTEQGKGTDEAESDTAGSKGTAGSESEAERKRSVLVSSKHGRTKSKARVKLPKECAKEECSPSTVPLPTPQRVHVAFPSMSQTQTQVDDPAKRQAAPSPPPPPPVPKSPPSNGRTTNNNIRNEKVDSTTDSTAYSPTAWALPTVAQLSNAAAHYVTGEDGKHIPFGSLFRARRTVVIFIRHFWCPSCQDYMSALTTLVKPEMLLAVSEDGGWEKIGVEDADEAKWGKGDEKERKKQGVDFVIISNGAHGMIAKYKQIFALPFKVYTDPSLAVYKALGMGREGDLLARQRQREHHSHQHQRQRDRQQEKPRTRGYKSQSESEKSEKEKGGKRDGGYVKHGLMSGIAMVVVRAIKVGMPVWEKGGDVGQLGGEFVLGPGLTCAYAHRMQTTKGHAPIQEVLEAAGVHWRPSPPRPATPAKRGPDIPPAHPTHHHPHSHSELLVNLPTLPRQEKERGKEIKGNGRLRKRHESMKTLRESFSRANSPGVTVSPLDGRDSRRYSTGVMTMTREEEEMWMEERQRSVERIQERKHLRRVHGTPGLSRSSSTLANYAAQSGTTGGGDGAGLGGAGVVREDDLDKERERNLQAEKTSRMLDAVGAKIERIKRDERENKTNLPRLPLVEEDCVYR